MTSPPKGEHRFRRNIAVGTVPSAQAPNGTEAAAARGLLGSVLTGLTEKRLPISAPTKSTVRRRVSQDHERMVPVEATLAMKALLWETMRRQQTEPADLATALKCTTKDVLRLLDTSMESREAARYPFD